MSGWHDAPVATIFREIFDSLKYSSCGLNSEHIGLSKDSRLGTSIPRSEVHVLHGFGSLEGGLNEEATSAISTLNRMNKGHEKRMHSSEGPASCSRYCV